VIQARCNPFDASLRVWQQEHVVDTCKSAGVDLPAPGGPVMTRSGVTQ
jgi:hypothetical protein